MTLIPSIMPGAAPFFLEGGDTGMLLMHGISASPDEVRWLGEYLHQRGLTVYGARAAGHGADYRHLSRMQWEDWYLSGLDGLHLLRQRCHRVFVGGMSMGGLLALLMSTVEQVDGVIGLATPLVLHTERQLKHARWLKYGQRFRHMPDRSDFPARLARIRQRRGDTLNGRVRYDIWAMQALAEFYELLRLVRSRLDQVTAPSLFIYSQNDPTVPYENLAYVQKHVTHAPLTFHTLEKSGHIITQDESHQEVFEQVAHFITDHTNGSL